MAELTASAIGKLTESGRYGDGDGLYLVVSKGGSKSWVQRIHVNGKRSDKGLGGFPAVSISAARKRARANKVAVSEGQDPFRKGVVSTTSRDKVPTFAEAAVIVHNVNTVRWKNSKHAASWLQTLERYAFPTLGEMQLDEITRADVLGVLTPIWTIKQETARRVRQRMRTTFKWGMAYGYIENNPAGEAIEGALPAMPKVQEHLAALPYDEVAGAIVKIKESESWDVTKAAFEFLILTAARSNEVRGATWDEIDLDANLWTVPGRRMKEGRDHRQPLSVQASTLLRRWWTQQTSLGSDWESMPPMPKEGLIFPTPNGQPLSDNALSLRARKARLGCVPHGFRSSFRDWAAEQTGASHAAIELSLSHSVGNAVERAYFRSDLLEQRRELMQEWANYLAPLPF